MQPNLPRPSAARAKRNVIIEVAAAVVLRADGAFLLAQRPAGKVYAGWWEFPGGKLDAGESASQALARELHEELGIHVQTAFPWITRVFTYPHGTVRLNFFRVTTWQGEPQSREGQQLLWQRIEDPLPTPMLDANLPVINALQLPSIYAITAASVLGEQVFLQRLELALQRGVRLIQFREKSLPLNAFAALAKQVISRAHAYGARVLINGTPAQATALGADGVHLTEIALHAMTKRPQGMLVAASCHDAHALAHAATLELDFVVLGAVAPTASHPGAQGMGWSRFAELTHHSTLPIYAIGGMQASDLPMSFASGAHGVAMIRGAWPNAQSIT